MGRRKSATLADLSAALGISVQTISKALRGLPGMSEETRSRIVQTAVQLGYLTAGQAREMMRQGIAPFPAVRMRFILVQSRESMNYNRLLTKGLQTRFGQFDHRLDTYVLDEDWTDSDYETWIAERNILHADGLFIAPRLISGTIEQKLLALPLPKVLINYPKPLSRVDSVVWDIYEAVCQSVDYLSRRGRRRILFVGDVHAQRGYVHRWQAYVEMMAELGQSPMRTTAEKFREAFARCSPDAVLAGIDEECEAVYDSLLALGLRIPEDCSFVGLLNEPSARYPDISRPVLAIEETGYQAADRMLWRIAHPNRPFEHTRILGGFRAGAT